MTAGLDGRTIHCIEKKREREFHLVFVKLLHGGMNLAGGYIEEY